MGALLSIPLRVMTRPFRTYRALAELPDGALAFPWGTVRFLFVLACFVAVIATGRFAPFETLVSQDSFSRLPVGHALGILVTVRLLAPRLRPSRALALHGESLGPWLVAFVVIPAVLLLAPQPRVALRIAPALVLGASAWSIVLAFALFRAGIGLPRGRAALATVLFLAVLVAIVVLYYLAAGQLWPIL